MRIVTLRRPGFHLLPLLFLLLLAGSAAAQSPNPLLTGLKGVVVQVVILNDAERKLGVDRATLYKAVTEALHEYKVNYLPLGAEYASGEKDLFQAMPAGYGLLWFKVLAVTDERIPGYSAAVVEMHLLEKVRLSRDPSKEVLASVYTGSNTILMRNGTPRSVTADVRDQARDFAADFRASNPGGPAAARRRGLTGARTNTTSWRRR
jgi:hypothetical protein